MKLIMMPILLLSFNNAFANISEKCQPPAGVYTSMEMVLNQFVFNNGNPNWGDWCYETSLQQSRVCISELNEWDRWLSCTKDGYTKHCRDWADKEGFLDGLGSDEYNAFINKCVQDNYRAL